MRWFLSLAVCYCLGVLAPLSLLALLVCSLYHWSYRFAKSGENYTSISIERSLAAVPFSIVLRADWLLKLLIDNECHPNVSRLVVAALFNEHVQLILLAQSGSSGIIAE